ncbi:MAG TPA: hypothetical protein VFE33_33125 [Thermoanaerobaculia bacterium]|nr:hypothetical protein [Thermoanaerobaculia bacterium]
MLSAVPLLLLLALTKATSPGPATWEPERAPAEDEAPTSAPTLAEIRARLAEAPRLDKEATLGPISLRGFHWAQEIALGTRWRAVVVSCQLGGGIIVFDAAGRLAGSWRTWEIQSLQLMDVDEDGTTELVTDQKDGVGTGLAKWNYHVYRMTAAGLRQIWQGESYFYAVDARGAVKERQGFLRFVPSGFGDPDAKLVHLVGPVGSGRFVQSVYVFKDGTFKKRKTIYVARP